MINKEVVLAEEERQALYDLLAESIPFYPWNTPGEYEALIKIGFESADFEEEEEEAVYEQ